MFLLPYIVAMLLWLKRRVPRVSSTRLLTGRWPSPLSRQELPRWLWATAASLAILASEDPAFTLSTHPSRDSLVANLAILLDMSGSMEASDWDSAEPVPEDLTPEQVPPSRITVAKRQIRQLLSDGRPPRRRAALLGFAQNTVLVSPLSDSQDVLLKRLEIIKTEHFSDGTSIGQAIRAAVNALKCAPDDGPRVIVLLSDGVDHAETDEARPELAAQEAAAEGIVIFAIGIGGSRLALHPVDSESGIKWKPVGEPLDMKQLQAIAKATNGQVYEAKDSFLLETAFESLKANLQVQGQNYKVRRTVPLAPWLLLAALLSSVAAAAISHRRRRNVQ